MLRRNEVLAASLLALMAAAPAAARPSAPLPDDALDGGLISAESLGRGGTIASNRATLAAGSENPASLENGASNAAYATALVDTNSDLDQDTAQSSDPNSGKVVRYLAMGSDNGVIYYEPLSRLQFRQVTDENSPTTDYRDVEYSADAIGFAGSAKWRGGRIGMSVAYLHSSIATTERASGQPDESNLDTADGLRINIGARIPKGPVMLGLLAQNVPGFLWGSDYRREMLPVKLRAGATWKAYPGFLVSFDAEKRYYHEGSHKENYYYTGTEWFASKILVIRAGLFGTSLDNSDERHVTGGATIIAGSGAEIGYAYEQFRQTEEKIEQHVVSMRFPFEASVEDVEK